MQSNNSISFGGCNQGLQVGQVGNHSSIHAEFHHLARPETPPSPFSNVPFPRDPDFVRRDTLIDQIHEKRSVPGARIAVTGLGGVGKSKLAIEYSFQIRFTSPGTWVFWIHSSNQARFEQSFRALAEQLKLPGRQDPQANILQLVENWLRDEKKGTWICVLDNVDDEYLSLPQAEGKDSNNQAKAPTNVPIKPLLEYIPRSPHGSTIITSRSKEVALKMVDHRDLVKVKPMEGSEGLDLFQKKLGSPENEVVSPEEKEERKKLVEALEFMPLAIVQAASHIRKRGSRYSVAQYLSDFKSDREAIKLLKKSAGFTYRDWEASNSILVTWEMTFNHLRETKPSAADLLSLMCFCDRQNIPEILLQDQTEVKTKARSQVSDDLESSQSDSDDGDDFEDDVATLADFAFISANADRSFMMHRLVQLSTRAWLKSHGQTEHWEGRFIENLARQFPIGEYDNWPKCQMFWPHMMAAVSQRSDSESQELLPEWTYLLCSGTHYAAERGLSNGLVEIALLSRNHMVKLFGAQSENAIYSTGMLGRAYMMHCQWDKATHFFAQVVEYRSSHLGKDHPLTLTSTSQLAIAHLCQGQWKEAEELEVQLLAANAAHQNEDDPCTLMSIANVAIAHFYRDQGEDTEKVLTKAIDKLGESHPATPMVADYLALLYRIHERFSEAERLELSTLAMNKTRLGDDHPETLLLQAKLARTYQQQSRWKEAENLLLRVLESQRVKLGESHLHTMITMVHLTGLYHEQGLLEEANRLNVQVMEICKTKFGQNNPFTLAIMGGLAMSYRDLQGRLEEACQLHSQVLEACKANLKDDDPLTLASMTNLAVTYREQGRLEEAKELNIQAVEACKVKFGESNSNTLASMSNLATIYWKQGHLEEACQLSLHVVEVCKEKLGVNHTVTLTSMSNLALVYQEQGRLEEAKQLNVQVIEARKTKLGLNHPETLKTMSNLAVIYHIQGCFEEAERLNLQVIEGRNTSLAHDHPDILMSIANLAAIYHSQGRLNEAERLNIQAFEGRKMNLGSDHPDTLASMFRLGSVYRDQQKWEESERMYVRALEGFKTKLGEVHPHTVLTTGCLAGVLKASGRDDEAFDLLQVCVSKYREMLGPDHPITVAVLEALMKWETASLNINS